MTPKPMNDAMWRAVDGWLSARALSEIANDGFAQADIDEFIESPDPVVTGLQLLRFALGQVKPSYPEVIAMLVVPLPATQDLVVSAPNLVAGASASWDYGPGRDVVSLYLMQPWAQAVDEPGEEYRCYVDAGEVMGDGLSVYFRSWRSQADAARGWEFNQAFYIRALVGDDGRGAVEDWLRGEAAPAYDALKADPSVGIPAEDVREEFEAKWRERSADDRVDTGDSGTTDVDSGP